jgi:hypothetical protein
VSSAKANGGAIQWSCVTDITVAFTGVATQLVGVTGYRLPDGLPDLISTACSLYSPKASGGGPFSALREFIEPSARPIHHVREEKQHRAEKEAPGEKPDGDDKRSPLPD